MIHNGVEFLIGLELGSVYFFNQALHLWARFDKQSVKPSITVEELVKVRNLGGRNRSFEYLVPLVSLWATECKDEGYDRRHRSRAGPQKSCYK